MKKTIFLLLLTGITQSIASDLVGAPYTSQRTVVLSFEGSSTRSFFYVYSGMTKKTIDALIIEKTRSTVQKHPKTIKFSSDETTFPEIITDDYLEAHYPEHVSIKLHVIEYTVPKRPSRF